MDPQGEMLLRSSSLDEQTMLLEGIPGMVLGFHAQQAVEKLLKALLSEKNLPYPRTHSIDDLVQRLLLAGESLPVTPIPLNELTSYAVVFRYADPTIVPPPDSENAISTVRILREFVLHRISEIESGPANP